MSDVTSLPTTQPAATADAADLGVVEAAVLLRAGSLSAVELTEACLSRIEERNGGSATFDGAQDAVNAWVRLYPELAREAVLEPTLPILPLEAARATNAAIRPDGAIR